METLPRRTQSERRNRSERVLLDAAVALVADGGVAAVTFEALGRAGGFSRGLAAVRFGSKAGLIEALLGHVHHRQEALIAANELDLRPGLDALVGYVDLCLRDLSRSNEARAYFRLLAWTVADAPGPRSRFADVHREVEGRLARWIARGQAEGAIRPEVDAHDASTMIGCLLLGLNMEALVEPGGGVERLRRAARSLLAAGIATAGAMGP